MKKRNIIELIIYVFGPLVLGTIVGLLTSSSTRNFNGPVPGWIFPVVWSILYILMGISSYLVRNNKRLIRIYVLSLIVNYLWSFIFFTFNLRVLGFFWILALILIVGVMIYEFYKENKTAAYLLIPYILWLIFASILNLSFIK